MGNDPPQQCFRASGDLATQGGAVHLDVADSGQGGELGGGHRLREGDLHIAHCVGPQPGHGVQGDQSTVANDADSVGDRLHLAHDVAGHEHRLPVACGLGDHLQKDLLTQRIQTGCRLVQDQQPRGVHERLDQPELLPVTFGQAAHLCFLIQFQTLAQRLDPLR
nr:hypothetical protein [Nocardia gamkensis]